MNSAYQHPSPFDGHFAITRDRPELFQVPEGGFEILLDADGIESAEKAVAEDLARNG